MPEVASTDMSDEQFVAGLYRNLLQRQPKNQEIEHWRAVLAGGAARTDVVEVFMSSSEYLNLQQQKERFRVSGNLPSEASEQEQYVLSELQARVARSQQGAQAKRTNRQMSAPQVTSDFSNLAKLSSDVWKAKEAVGQLNPRNAGLINSLVQGSKKILQRSLSWYTRSLQAFHQEVATAVEQQGQAIAAVDRSYQQLRGDTHKLDSELRRQEGEIRELESEIRRQQNEIIKLHSDYLQNTVRAMEYATQEHFAPYVEFFRTVPAPIVDLGCGRGEFLNLLKEAGMVAYGVDSDEEACVSASGKGLKVFNEDAFEHLSELPERSLGGVFSARLVEFLPPHLQAKLIGLCAARMKPGGVLLIETTNPSSHYGYGRVTNLDLTHLRPVSPELMVSMFQSSSFRDAKVLVPAPVELPVNNNPMSVSGNGDAPARYGKALLTTPVYAVVGWRK